MASVLLRAIYSLCFIRIARANPQFGWAISSGGSSSNFGRGIAHDLTTGGALVTGSFQGTAAFGATTLTSSGNADVFVALVSASGVVQWAVDFGGSRDDNGYCIASDGVGGALLTGDFGGTASFGTTTLTASGGANDVFVAHVSASGVVQWAVSAGSSTSYDNSNAVAPDGSGGAFVTGSFGGTASFGTTTLTSGGATDVFVAHVSAAGVWQWAIGASGPGSDYGYGIAPDGSGGALVTGTFSNTASFGAMTLTSGGQADVFVARVSASGAVQQAVRAGGSGYDAGTAIVGDGTGGALLTGYFRDTASFGATALTSGGNYDVFVAHMSGAGVFEWALGAGGSSSSDQGHGIASDGASGAFVTGWFAGTASFGAATLTSAGSTIWDVFVARVQAPSPPPYRADAAAIAADPHITFAGGGAADFRGSHRAYYAFLSSPGFQFAPYFQEVDFWHYSATGLKQLVHGTYMTKAAWRVRTSQGKELLIKADAMRRGELDVFMLPPSLPGVDPEHTISGASLGQAAIQVSTTTLKQNQKLTIDDVSLATFQLTVMVDTPTWQVNVSQRPVYNLVPPFINETHVHGHWAVDQKRLDISIAGSKPQIDAHGVVGQSYHPHYMPRNGKMDDYDHAVRPTRADSDLYLPPMATAAQAEGAIEGVYTDYKVSDGGSTAFKYSAYERVAQPIAGPVQRVKASTTEWEGRGQPTWLKGRKREL